MSCSPARDGSRAARIAEVARLIASGAAVWAADEFCATLDPMTANIVCRNLRRCAKQLGVTVLLAAANWSEFIYELQPDIVVHLRAPWDSQVFSWKEFCRATQKSNLVVGNRLTAIQKQAGRAPESARGSARI